jgi:hypothetical protein
VRRLVVEESTVKTRVRSILGRLSLVDRHQIATAVLPFDYVVHADAENLNPKRALSTGGGGGGVLPPPTVPPVRPSRRPIRDRDGGAMLHVVRSSTTTKEHLT